MSRRWAIAPLLFVGLAGCRRGAEASAQAAAPVERSPASFAAPPGWSTMILLPSDAAAGYQSPDGAASLVLTETTLPAVMSEHDADAALAATEHLPEAWRNAGLRRTDQGRGRFGPHRLSIYESELAGGATRLKQYVLLDGRRLLTLTGSAPAGAFAAAEPLFDASAGSIMTDGGSGE